MMGMLRHIQSGKVFNTEDTPMHKGGMWECGDQRFADRHGTQYEVVTPLPAPITIISPIELKLKFTSAERVAINSMKSTDAGLADFIDILDDPRLSAVYLELPATIEGVAYTINAIASSLAYDQAAIDARIAVILST